MLFRSIINYTTNLKRYKDNTPVCVINRDALLKDISHDLTFAENISVKVLRDVIQKSGISPQDKRTLLIISTTKGNIECIESDFASAYLWSLADKISSYFHFINRPLIISNACISGVASIVAATREIEANHYDNVIVLGIDVVSEFIVSGFNSFKSISDQVCIPYDKQRNGLTLGEGCAAILLTNNKCLSESGIVVSGGGINDDANHISGPSRTGDGLFFAIDTAMKKAGVTTLDIGFINAHGTATSFNDEMESKAINMAGLTDVPCNSMKPYLGHTLGASGVIETILCIRQLSGGVVFGVKGYKENGVPFELNVSAQHRNINVNHCLKTASGFGGTNAALILSKDTCLKKLSAEKKHADITEISHVVIEKQHNITFSEYIRNEYKLLGDTNLKFFKMDNLSKLGYVASCKLMKDIVLPFAPERIAVVIANSSSSLDTDINHQEVINKRLPEGTSPSVFVYTLANIVAAEIAIKHKCKGEQIGRAHV